MADQIKKLSAGHSIEVLDTIMTEVEEARGEYESLDARLDEISGEGYSKAEVDALLALKQNALTTAQLAAVNSGIDSAKVAQIETNKNNISWLVDTGVKNLLDYGKIKTNNTFFTWSGNTGTYNGVTIKIESNAIKISASNTSASVNIYVSSETDTWKNGNTYHLMGVPQASVDNVNLNIQSGSPDYYTYYTKISNQEVTFPNVGTRIRFSIASGATFSEVTIPLMMCSVAAYSASSTYQPYALSNAELTDNTQIIDITSGITVATGFTKSGTTHIYKQGKHIFGTLIFKKDSGSYPTSGGDTVGSMGDYAPVAQWLGGGFFSDDVWKVQSCGYAFIQAANGQSDAGNIIVTDTTSSHNYVKIQIDYVMP